MNSCFHLGCLCRRGRKCRYNKGYIHAYRLFWPRHQVDICGRGYCGADRCH